MKQAQAQGSNECLKMSLAETAERWRLACLAAELLQADTNCPGLIISSRTGPVRDAFLRLLPASKRIHPAVGRDALLGGIDVSATLTSGTLMKNKGLIGENTTILVAMAERLPSDIAALLAQSLDTVKGLRLILLDESAGEDEGIAPVLRERLPYRVDLDGIPATGLLTPEMRDIGTHLTPDDAHMSAISTLCETLGVASARAAYFATRTALMIAQLENRVEVTTDDLSDAASLVLSHRATRLPQTAEDPPPPPPEAEKESSEDVDGSDSLTDIPQELLLDAVLSALPPDTLARLSGGPQKGAKGSGSGAKIKGNRRGRPLPPRASRYTSDQRIDLFATLRAAAPWQTIRVRETGRTGPHIRPSDLRAKRYEERSDRLIIFAVDASGSAAISRLAEAKGAIELLLGEAYARRDHVALVSFRGKEAEVLLSPTRSLVQTKRRLANLPGGRRHAACLWHGSGA